MSQDIMIVTPGSYPIPSSLSSSVETSVSQIAPFLADKLAITVVGRKFPSVPYQSVQQGIKYINVPANNRQAYLQDVIRFQQKYPSTIIQIENRPMYVAHLKEKFPTAKVWLVLHSITFLQKGFRKKRQLERSLHLADRIIVNSQFLKEYITLKLPTLFEKIGVHYLGVNIEKFQYKYAPEVLPLIAQEKAALGLGNKQVILFVGRLIPQKGVHHLLQTFSMIKDSFSNSILLIIGGNDYGKNRTTSYVHYLKRLAHPLKEQVRFIPFTPYHQMEKWYRIADMLITPSIGQEAFGLVNLEALSTGIPVIATQIGGIPEIIKHQENGLLVPVQQLEKGLSEAIALLLQQEEWARKLGERGRKGIEMIFTWEKSAAHIYPLYLQDLQTL